MIIIPAPWDVTVSYHDGTSRGPQAILDASYQVDLYVKDIPDAWQLGVCMLPVPDDTALENKSLRAQAITHIKKIESGENVADEETTLSTINSGCEKFNQYIMATSQKYLREGEKSWRSSGAIIALLSDSYALYPRCMTGLVFFK
jgi:agmatinase